MSMGGYSVYVMTVSKTDLKTNRSMKNSVNESAPNMTWKKVVMMGDLHCAGKLCS